MKVFSCLVVLTMFFLIEPQLGFAFSFDKDPHTRRVACNSCHGQRDDHGFPESGAHKSHNEKWRFSSQNAGKFDNESFEEGDLEDPNPQDSVHVPNETNWDLCDECHHASVPFSQVTDLLSCDPCHTITPDIPSTEEPDNVLHIDGQAKVTFMDTTATYNKTVKTCSGLDNCHTTTATNNVRWGIMDRTPKQLKHDFFRDLCRDCHLNLTDLEKKDRGEVFLPQPINDLCNQCHGPEEDQEIKVRHFYDKEITPDFERILPDVFPFEDERTFTCVTCHAPHGEICQSCHSLNDEEVNSHKETEKVFAGRVYDPVDIGFDEWEKNTTPIRRGNVYLRTFEELNYDYYSHSFLYTESSLMKKSFCVGCHEMPRYKRIEKINLHLNFQCNDCHLEIPYTRRICYKVESLVGDFYPTVDFDTNASLIARINPLCSRCHLKDHFHVPKKRLTFQKGLPKDLPLNAWKEMTCTTCHDPHVRYGETGLIFRRLTTSGRGLCEECHAREEKFKKTNPHGDKSRCVYCHLTEPDRKSRATEEEKEILTKAYASRCEICHSTWGNTHPINVPPFDSNELALPLNRQEMLSCASCHDYHDPEEIIIPKESPENGYCDACHKK